MGLKVKNGWKSNWVTAYLSGLSVVWLSLVVSSGITPIASVSLGGWADLNTWSTPEPSVLIWWLQIWINFTSVRWFLFVNILLRTWSVASSKVTFSAWSPNISNIATGDSLLDEFVFLWGFERYGIHAMTSANISGIEPVDLQAFRRLMFPTEEVRMSDSAGITICGMSYTVRAWSRVRQRESSLGHRDRSQS